MIGEVTPTSLAFTINPRTMQMLGRENVSSAMVAILELVKNAYDADAGKVWLRFKAASQPDGSIWIEDNGVGMDLDDLRGKWMSISTNNKQRDPITSKGRVKVGETGIGRLALDRLARLTSLTTHRRNKEGLKVLINWTAYERQEGQLHEITHPLVRVPARRDDRSGTVLELRGLRDRWTSEDYATLYSDLSLLIPPYDTEPAEFEIIFDCDEAPELCGPVRSRMDALAEYDLASTLSGDGRIHHVLTSRSGQIIEDSRDWQEAFDGVAAGYRPACGAVALKVHFYLRDVASLRGTSIDRADLLFFLERYQGIRIYRDNFRVMPYGDPLRGGDWLGLNARRVKSPAGVATGSGGWRVAENQVVGRVLLTRQGNPALDDQTNREGLVANLAFRDLRAFVLHGIEFLERERQKHRQLEKPARKSPREAETTLDAAVTGLLKQAQSLRGTLAALSGGAAPAQAPVLRAVIADVERWADAVAGAASAVNERETERQLMLGLATVGIAMAAFGHETARSINLVLANSVLLQRPLDLLPEPPRVAAKDNLATLVKAADRIDEWGQFALDRVRRDKRTIRDIDLSHAIRNSLKPFAGLLARLSVKTEFDLPAQLPLYRAFAMEVEAIIINLVTNAIVALEQTPLSDRRISVSTAYEANSEAFRITFADSGKGIPDQDIGRIWDPLFTTKVDDKGRPIGTGLGLTIVRSIVEEHDGSITLVGHGRLGGAEFSVVLPKQYIRRIRNGP
jgi:signal transduction histidine kinase